MTLPFPFWVCNLMEPKFNWSKIIQSLSQDLDGTQKIFPGIKKTHIHSAKHYWWWPWRGQNSSPVLILFSLLQRLSLIHLYPITNWILARRSHLECVNLKLRNISWQGNLQSCQYLSDSWVRISGILLLGPPRASFVLRILLLVSALYC